MLGTLDREEVQLVRWPAEAALRDHCRALGVPRLLVVERGASAPISADFREDWVRAPICKNDLKARVAALRARVSAHRVPQLDPSGVIRFGTRSVTISPTQAELLELLVERFGQLVPRKALGARIAGRPGGATRNALDLHIMRLRRRIQPLGLAIRTAWGRGYLLEAAELDGR
ncbi:Transcriptional regulatory protein, C terminal [Streptoalloteichus tenebrarius]|uniref:Transcriptional regulatory protein, C terminal n=1 Tax=Streptoalloteichus tenebrarius (strain ATCC 17920 / DSM 40477 / JCM 4838 / CBS 697.72 / NBRC 16177 / NCIMB 11028 / NRRL B-12390 / A12253. 1 / ISP 5477) TaxID=1933 RepID=A0ABT1HU52_STRSD|nr:helix-turn-helix domain-containing protein [Streptoalloteichus tenebrarius]MCP2259026.1 Transcriptional regulatory protein, C terminal [Streptoalloteichus tenebrarius]BFE99649.1 hypothetical protein GCM10020241_13250 [Streptoalloteichus tenebrarius]